MAHIYDISIRKIHVKYSMSRKSQIENRMRKFCDVRCAENHILIIQIQDSWFRKTIRMSIMLDATRTISDMGSYKASMNDIYLLFIFTAFNENLLNKKAYYDLLSFLKMSRKNIVFLQLFLWVNKIFTNVVVGSLKLSKVFDSEVRVRVLSTIVGHYWERGYFCVVQCWIGIVLKKFLELPCSSCARNVMFESVHHSSWHASVEITANNHVTMNPPRP